jgi:transposase
MRRKKRRKTRKTKRKRRKRRRRKRRERRTRKRRWKNLKRIHTLLHLFLGLTTLNISTIRCNPLRIQFTNAPVSQIVITAPNGTSTSSENLI